MITRGGEGGEEGRGAIERESLQLGMTVTSQSGDTHTHHTHYKSGPFNKMLLTSLLLNIQYAVIVIIQ